MVGLLALLSCPQHEYALLLKCEEFPVYQPSQPDECKPHNGAADYRDAPILCPISPSALISSTNGLPPLPALVEPIQILLRLSHRILVVLLLLDCWGRSLPQLVRT
jgi:hypothetical protein